ncbi:MAG: hypothetical protein BMS9Abin01_2017 [Gammaproteobacteria bacterium]|nr:MAG: hypothetical protein BMS9Abin01_2017 [Gammaproteobacteria bacterium]
MTDEDQQAAERIRTLTRVFRIHATLFGAIIGGLTIWNIIEGGRWWSFWPTVGWGAVLAVHFFFTKSACVDDRWVEERENDLRTRSYDLSHIADLEERIASRHPSVRTPEERER